MVVWFGGMLYQAVVTSPVARVEQRQFDPFVRHLLGRFQPFVWMCVWTILVTGAVLMLFDPRFLFLNFESLWSVLLAAKQLIFVLMVFFGFGYARMWSRLESALAAGEPDEQAIRFYKQMLMFGKINVALAIIALLVASGMSS
ncbi:MAG: hypothetical protein KF749_14015 [Bacteroidetes bacterium]|nr:hypothetical protein [Bacteroidota bacterium]MCW5895233.1 hypothetical protein [Bacteroidota bacterium]